MKIVLIFLSLVTFSSKEFFKLIERRNPASNNIYIVLDNAGYCKGKKIAKVVEQLQKEFGAEFNSLKILPTFSYTKISEYPFAN